MDIAERVDRIQEGRKLVVSLQSRIDNIRMRAGQRRRTVVALSIIIINNQKYFAIEWINPFFTAGHWIPQMIEIAGGINGLSSRGQLSRRMYIDEIIKYNPDKIILMPCGFDIDKTLTEAKTLEINDKWKSLLLFKVTKFMQLMQEHILANLDLEQ